MIAGLLGAHEASVIVTACAGSSVAHRPEAGVLLPSCPTAVHYEVHETETAKRLRFSVLAVAFPFPPGVCVCACVCALFVPGARRKGGSGTEAGVREGKVLPHFVPPADQRPLPQTCLGVLNKLFSAPKRTMGNDACCLHSTACEQRAVYAENPGKRDVAVSHMHSLVDRRLPAPLQRGW